MNHEALVEQAMRILPYHQRVNPPDGECSCGHVTPLGRMASEHVARAVVDAILPQVTTVEELVTSADRALLIDRDGRPWRERGWRWETWARKTVTAADLWANYGPLTVVWQP